MIKEFIETFKELKNEYVPNLTPRMVFFGIIVFILVLSIITSIFAYNYASRQNENASIKIDYINLNEKTIIKKGETLYIDDKELSNIKYESVVDSRCPKDAQCIVAGELTYNMHYNSRDKDEDFIISTVRNRVAVVNGYVITVSSGEKNYIELVIEKETEEE
jgi:hypothetical protein